MVMEGEVEEEAGEVIKPSPLVLKADRFLLDPLSHSIFVFASVYV